MEQRQWIMSTETTDESHLASHGNYTKKHNYDIIIIQQFFIKKEKTKWKKST